ncbi:MAG: PQQ-binding-like beta-propeller repeat protein [Anaerolineae bacterium]|nr:PQQ-binding-like beta-propeller repeat protein [Anaerolineae bacterium]
MIRFPDGGFLLDIHARPRLRSLFFLVILLALSLTACAEAVGGNNNWPGLSTNGELAFVAAGPHIYALDIEAQTTRWQYPAEAGRTSFFASPAAANDRLVFGDFGASGGTFSSSITVSIYGLENLNSTAPNNLWAPVSGVARDRIVAAPLLTESQIFIGTADGQFYALSARDGTVQWRFAASHAIWGQPAYHNNVVYFTSLDKNLYALSAADGELLWQHSFTGTIPSGPVIGNNLIYVAGFNSQVHALSLESGREEWQFTAQDWLWSSPVLDGETLYIGDRAGNAYALNAQTGEELWQRRVTEHIQATPVVNGNQVYFAATIGNDTNLDKLTGEVVAINKETGEVLWRKNTPGPIFTAPILVQEKVVVVFKTGRRFDNDFQVNVYNQADGNLLWEFVPAK